MKDKKILLIVSGGIAAYKAIDLVSKLYKEGTQIKTIMTKSALEFVSPINFSAVGHGTVHKELFSDDDPIPHISLADWADLIVVAPATANLMGKAVSGIADDLASTTLLAATSPILWVPAMNVHMYENPATQMNLALLRDRGHFILEPESGALACGYEGKGKYPRNDEVIFAIKTYLYWKQDLTGKRILISAGACSEMIDPMRCLTNLSSGKTGISLARAAALRGAIVTLVYAGIKIEFPHYLDRTIEVRSAEEMYQAIVPLAVNQDWIIMAAAVTDYTPVSPANKKIKKLQQYSLDMIKTKDILAELSKNKRSGQLFIGFAAETDDLIKNARAKLTQKKLNLIAANYLNVVSKDHTEIIVLDADKEHIIKADKFEAAHQLLSIISAYER